MSLKIFWQKNLQKCFLSILYQTYHFCPNFWIWLVAMATERLKLRKILKNHLLEAIRGIKLKLCSNIHYISLYKNGVFYCRCSCTLVAMAMSLLSTKKMTALLQLTIGQFLSSVNLEKVWNDLYTNNCITILRVTTSSLLSNLVLSPGTRQLSNSFTHTTLSARQLTAERRSELFSAT